MDTYRGCTMKLNILTATMLASGMAIFATSANAAVTTDKHGNVGYDSYDECVAAVKSGDAKFYTPYTYQKPKLWKGEASVKKMALSEVEIPESVSNDKSFKTRDYEAGACDRGVGQSKGRYGVSGELVGKYVPIAADMPVNVYMDRAGNPVRITMQQCDNHFSSNFPMPIVSEAKAPDAEVQIEEKRDMEVVTTSETRTVRRVANNNTARPTTYNVKEVLMVPSDQVKQLQTNTGDTAIAIQNQQRNAVVVGEEAGDEVLENIQRPTEEVPVYVVPKVQQPTTIVQ